MGIGMSGMDLPAHPATNADPPRLFQREGVEVGGLIISAYIPPPPQPKEKSRGKESGDGHCKMLEAGVLEPRYNPHPLPSSFRVNC